MAKIINARMSQKHDTEAHWKLAINFIPLKGELIIYDVDANNPNERIKIGNLELGNLPKGKYRYLTKQEVNSII